MMCIDLAKCEIPGSIPAVNTWWFRSHGCGLDRCSRQTIKVFKKAQIQKDRHTCTQTHTYTHRHTQTQRHRRKDTDSDTSKRIRAGTQTNTNSQIQTHKHKHSYTNAHILPYGLKQKHRDTLAEEHIQKHAHVKHLFRRQQYFTNVEMFEEQTCFA
jgi:hypothetical protein